MTAKHLNTHERRTFVIPHEDVLSLLGYRAHSGWIIESAAGGPKVHDGVTVTLARMTAGESDDGNSC